MPSTATLKVEDWPSVTDRLQHLGLTAPAGLAFLPANFDTVGAPSDFRYAAETPTLRKLMTQAGVAVSAVGQGKTPAYVVNRGAGWVAPTIFVSVGLLTENREVAAIILNVISNYVYDLFKGQPEPPAIKVEVVVEKEGDKTTKRITYEGDHTGLGEIRDALLRIADE